MSDDWCTIESDPGVFTEMLSELGCNSVELEELYMLDDDALLKLEASGKVHGLIFLFKWMGKQQQEHAATKTPLAESDIPPNLFFAHQVTTNACATQAILSVVLNAGLSQEQLGSTLNDFGQFTTSFPPQLVGEAISSSPEIKACHNRFGRTDAFLQEGKVHTPTDDAEAFHFVAYVPLNNAVYELDGLQSGPIVVGSVEEEKNWLSIAREAIQERMTAGGDHVKFNLMAVIQDKRIKLKETIETLDPASSECAAAVADLQHEETKREQWKIENQRRRHNYVPLCMQLIQELAKAGKLPELTKAAKERQAELRKMRMESKKSGSSQD